MNWDHLGVQLTTVLVAIFGAGGVGVEWLRRRAKQSPPLPREEADVAQAAQVLPESVQIVTAALTERINSIQTELNAKIEHERAERIRTEQRWQRRYERLHGWAMDIITRWDEHRQEERPPVLPD